MPKQLTNEEVYDKCTADGMFIPQKDIDTGKIKSMLRITEEDLKTISELKEKGDRWNTSYKLNYDVLHTLCEAFLMFDNIKSLNHQCLFSYLCIKHPELDLDWDFFEKVRTKRNGIHYYGTSVGKDEYKQVEFQMSL